MLLFLPIAFTIDVWERSWWNRMTRTSRSYNICQRRFFNWDAERLACWTLSSVTKVWLNCCTLFHNVVKKILSKHFFVVIVDSVLKRILTVFVESDHFHNSAEPVKDFVQDFHGDWIKHILNYHTKHMVGAPFTSLHRPKQSLRLLQNNWLVVVQLFKRYHTNKAIKAGVQKYGRAIAPRDQKVYAREWDFQRQIIDGKVYSGVCYQKFLRATKFQKNLCTPELR